MADSAVRVNFLGDSSSLDRAMAGVRKDIGTTEGAVKKKFSGIALAAGLAGGALAISFGKKSIDAFKESEDAQNRLSDAFAKFPQLAGANIGELQKLNTELSKKTKFDDDATASGQAVLAQFGLTAAEIAKATPLLQDYAAKTGKDLPAAAEIFGKAMLGKGKALGEVGLKFKDAGSAQANYTQVMDGLRQQVGGFAEKEGKTAAGQAQILGNQFGEVQETVGSKLVPILTKLAGMLLQVVDFVQKNSAVLVPLVGAIGGLAAIVLVVVQAQKAFVAVQTAVNLVMSMNPIGLVVLAIVALIAIVVLAYKNSETFRNIVDGAFKVVREAAAALWHGIQVAFDSIKAAMTTAAKWIGDKVGDVVGFFTALPGKITSGVKGVFKGVQDAAGDLKTWVSERVDDVVGFFKGIPGRIAGSFSNMFDGIGSAFRSAINSIIRGWNNLSFTLSVPALHIPGTNRQIGGAEMNFSPPNIPMLARGGIVNRPTLAMIGEAGPEAVVPLGRMGMTVQIILSPGVYDRTAVAQEIVQTIRGYKRTLGGADLGIA